MKGDSKSGVSKTRNTTSGSSCKKVSPEDNRKMETGEECRTDEQAFLVALYKYMKERKTPIERIPYLGFKQSKCSFYTGNLKHSQQPEKICVTSTKWMAFEKVKYVSEVSVSQKNANSVIN